MKKLFFTLFASIVFISMYGQVPQEINYQGVARNSLGTLLSNQNIGIKLDLHQGSAVGTVVFSEAHNKTTNVFGLFNLGIGSVNTSVFSAINWANGPYFLEVSMDPAGGTSYSSVGTQQFMSVPYALYAQTAGNASLTPTITINAPNTITSSAGSYTINVPAAISYSAGTGIDITGGIISNTASATTPTINSGGVANVTNPSSNVYLVDVPAPTLNYNSGTNELTLTQNGATSTATINGSGSNTVSIVGSGLASVTPTTGSTFTVSVPNPTLSIGSGSLSISNGNSVAIPSPSLSINSNSLTINGPGGNTVLLPSASTTSLTQGSNVMVTGTAPNYTVSSPAYSISLPGGNTVQITNGVSTSSAAINATSLTLTGVNNNILSAGGNTVGLNTYTAGNGITISGTAPNYTLASLNQSLSITGNSLSISGANTVTIPTSTINALGTGIATVTTSVNNFTVNVPAPTYLPGTGVLNFGGTNTVVVTPTLSLSGTTLTSGASTNSVNLSSLSVWSNSLGVLYPTVLTNSVGIGTSGPISGKVEISHSATAANPHLNFVSPSGAYGIVKYSNTGQANYFSTEYINDGSGINEAFSINQFNGTNSKPVLLINGQRMTYVNALNFPLATFHVMTSTATASGGIASEGFAQSGQLNIVRNNNAGAGARSSVILNDEIGKINFAGFDGSTFGDGAKIYAKAAENVTGSNKGTELIFAAVPTGTNTNKDVFKINGANKLEVITGMVIPFGAANGKVLTSDAVGNVSWQNTSNASPWIQGAGIVTQTNFGDKVGIGTNTPNSPFQVLNYVSFENIGSNTSLGFNTGTGVSPNNYYNTMVGAFAGQTVGTGSSFANTFMGYQSGLSNSNGSSNTFVGSEAGKANTASNNTYLGANAGRLNTSGNANVFLGANSGAVNTVGTSNVFLGFDAGKSNTNGTDNTFIGRNSGPANTTGSSNIYIGSSTGNLSNTASFNVFLGNSAGNNTTNGNSNVFIGYQSGLNNSTGQSNTFIGRGSDLFSTTQYTNATAIGYNTKVNDNDLVVLGNNSNVAVGSTKAAVLSGATRYLSIVNNGPYSTASNTSLELQANSNGGNAPVGRIDFINGLTPTGIARIEAITGTGSTTQGALCFYTNNTGLTEALRITQMGYVGIGSTTPGGQLELSLDQGRKPGTSVWTITSDERLKNIQGFYTKGLSEILKLQPIIYYYKNVGERKFENDVTKTLYAGFSAQEVQKIFPEAVSVDADGYLNFNIHAILIAYTNAVKELNAKAESQEKVIKEQKKLIESLELDFDNRLKLLEQRLESKTQK